MESTSTQRRKLIAVAITLFAIAFIAYEVGQIIDGNETTGRLVTRGLAIVSACAFTVWGWLRVREKSGTN